MAKSDGTIFNSQQTVPCTEMNGASLKKDWVFIIFLKGDIAYLLRGSFNMTHPLVWDNDKSITNSRVKIYSLHCSGRFTLLIAHLLGTVLELPEDFDRSIDPVSSDILHHLLIVKSS